MVTIEFSEIRGPNKRFGSFVLQNEPNILFGPLISENSIVKPPLVLRILGYDVIPKLAFLIPNQMPEILKSL